MRRTIRLFSILFLAYHVTLCPADTIFKTVFEVPIAQTGFSTWQSPVIGNGQLFVGRTATFFEPREYHPTIAVSKLDPATGKLLWNFSASPGELRDFALGESNRLYCLANDAFYVLNTDFGNVEWKIPVSIPDSVSMALGEFGRAYFANSSNIICLDTRSRKVDWSQPFHSWIITHLAYSNGRLYLSTGDGPVECRSAFSGDLIWSTPIDPQTRPILAPSGEIVVGESSRITVLNGETGQQLWSIPFWDPSTLVVDSNRVLYAIGRTNLTAVDLKTSTELWTFPSVFITTPLLLGNESIILFNTNSICKIDTVSGTLIDRRFFSHPLEARTLNVDDGGYLFFIAGDTLYKWGPVGLLTTSSWPKDDVDSENTATVRFSELPPQLVGPQDIFVPAGNSAVFEMSVYAAPPYRIQWFRDGRVLSGASNSVLVIASAQVPDTGAQFYATVSNTVGVSTSRVATLNVGFKVEREEIGGSIKLDPDQDAYLPGTRVTATAFSFNKKGFLEWSGDISSSENPVTFTVETNITIRPNFNDRAGDVLWTFRAPNAWCSGPALDTSEAQAFVSSSDGNVYALSARLGTLTWRTNLGTNAIWLRLPPVYGFGMVFCATSLSNTVTALDAPTGTKRWIFRCDSIPRPVAIGEERVYVASQNWMYALAARTGDLLWRANLVQTFSDYYSFKSAPVVGPGFVCIYGNGLMCFDEQSGRLRWKSNLASAEPAVAFDGTLISALGSSFTRISPIDGSVLAEHQYTGRFNSPIPILILPDGLFAASIDERRSIFGTLDFSIIWEASSAGRFLQLLENDEVVSSDSSIVGADLFTGKTLWYSRSNSRGEIAVAADGTVFSGGESVTALKGSAPPLLSSWPTSMGDSQNTRRAQSPDRILELRIFDQTTNGISLLFTTLPGKSYSLQKLATDSAVWVSYASFTATNEGMMLRAPYSADKRGIFRVVQTE
jgi:outer membrane protein assembly factor BamB